MLSRNYILQNRYRIFRPLGRGGMGNVYEAMDENTRRIVAVKERLINKQGRAIDDKMRRAFEHEAYVLASLSHEALPQVIDHFMESDGQFIVMEFIEGLNLAQLLKYRGTHFPFKEVLVWANKLLDALEYMHDLDEPVIHRDIKPANIKITDKNKVYLLDFGLAKGGEGLITSSVHGYTAEYAPLEQLSNATTDEQSDLYSLGATLYHLLTGAVPVKASIRDELIEKGKDDPLLLAHEVNPDVPQPLSNVLSKAMALRRRDRLTSATAMLQALQEAAQAIEAEETSRRETQREEKPPDSTEPSPVKGTPIPAETGGLQPNLSTLTTPPSEVPHPPSDAFAENNLPASWPSHLSEPQDSEANREAEQKAKEEQLQSQLADLYAAGRRHLEAGRWQEAIKNYQDILTLDARQANAALKLREAEKQRDLFNLYTIGQGLYERGLWGEALDYFNRVEELEGNHRDTRALIGQAKEHLAKLEADQVEREKREREAKLLQEKQAEAKQFFEQALIAIARSRFDYAIKKLKAAQALDPANTMINAKLEECKAAVRQVEEIRLHEQARRRTEERRAEESRRQAEPEPLRQEDKRPAQEAEEEKAKPDGEDDAEVDTEHQGAAARAASDEARQQAGRDPEAARSHLREQAEKGYEPLAKRGPRPLLLAPANRKWLIAAAAVLALGLTGVTVLVVLYYTNLYFVNRYRNSGAPTTPSANTSVNSNQQSGGLTARHEYRLEQTLHVQGKVWSVAYAPNGKLVAGAGDDKAVHVWDAQTLILKARLEGHQGVINSIAFSSNSRLIASGSSDRTIKVWNSDDGSLLYTLTGHTGKVLFIAFSPDGRSLASGSEDQSIRLWDLTTGREVVTMLGHNGEVWAVAFSPDGTVLASASKDQTIKIWSVRTAEEIELLREVKTLDAQGTIFLIFSPDGETLASGHSNMTINLWDWKTGQRLKTLNDHKGYVTSLSFSGDGATLASASKDKTIKIWDTQTGQPVQTLTDHTDSVESVSFSSDGKTLLSGGRDQTFRLWRMTEQ